MLSSAHGNVNSVLIDGRAGEIAVVEGVALASPSMAQVLQLGVRRKFLRLWTHGNVRAARAERVRHRAAPSFLEREGTCVARLAARGWLFLKLLGHQELAVLTAEKARIRTLV